MEDMTVKEILAATNGILLCGEDNQPLYHISIDSRKMEGTDLFVPLIGEKVDAHRFIQQAIDHGACAVLTSQHDEMNSSVPWIRVEDTLQALQKIGSYCRNRLRLPLVGITGSVGKTTTREMVAAALSAKFRVFKTPANHNSQVGVPITISEISCQDEIGVLELGMSEPGELTVIAQIARTPMALITNIGVTHMEQLGTQDNIYREKLSIQDGMEDGGILLLNGDDPYLSATKAKKGCKTIYYGMGENCDYRAVDLTFEAGFPSFTAVHADERAQVKLRVMGKHNVQTAMAALAVAREYGIYMKDAAKVLADFTGFQNRQQIYEYLGITVIDDTYNASPASMKAALEVLASMDQAKRRIAVLADMKELGVQALEFHHEVGVYVSTLSIDQVVTLGELAKELGRGAGTKGMETHSFEEKQSLTDYLDSILQPGDCVLFKGSNSMKLGEAAIRYLPPKQMQMEADGK